MATCSRVAADDRPCNLRLPSRVLIDLPAASCAVHAFCLGCVMPTLHIFQKQCPSAAQGPQKSCLITAGLQNCSPSPPCPWPVICQSALYLSRYFFAHSGLA